MAEKAVCALEHPCVLKGHVVVFLLCVNLLVSRMVLVGMLE